MDLIYMNKNKEDIGVLQDYELDMAFGADENDFECTIQAKAHCCEAGDFLYMEGKDYGGIIDSIQSKTDTSEVIYKGRTWHGILGSKVILPLQEGEGGGGGPTSRLPEGYTELIYIESTGTQFIDTGVILTNLSSVKLRFQLTSNSEFSVFGSRASATSNNFTIHHTSAELVVDYRTHAANRFRATVGMNIVDVSITPTTCVIGDSSFSISGTDAFTTPDSAYIFNASGSMYTSNKGLLKLYSCCIYDGDVLIRDFIPCRNPDGVVGLYDIVNGVFYGNAGSGVFYGMEKRTLPEGFTQVEYIQSSGTEYIDTGFKPNINTKFHIDYQITTAPSAVNGIFGARPFWHYYSPSSVKFVFENGSSAYFADGTATNRSVVDMDIDSYSFNGTQYTMTSYNLSSTIPVYVFCTNNAGSTQYLSAMRLFAFRIYDNGTLVRDYVPCFTNDGKVGLYDLVTNAFFGNAGTGSFSFKNMPSVALPEGYTQVEYIESNGTQYIDTNFMPNQDTSVIMDVVLSNVSNNALFGARTSASSKTYCLFWMSQGYYRMHYNNGYTNFPADTFDPTVRHTVEYIKNILTVNGATITRDYAAFQCAYNMTLLAVNAANSMSLFASCKVYSCQIFDNGVLVRNFIPCKNADSVGGLYDLVNGVFYGNSGTGTFSVGADISADEPEADGEGSIGVTVETEDADGNSLVNRYLIISGDANACVGFILERCGLSDMFEANAEQAGVMVGAYQFHRYTDAFTGLSRMLSDAGLKMRMAYQDGKLRLSSLPIHDFSLDDEFDSDLVDFELTKKYKAVNHLICLGKGELEARTVIHLYVDADGNISQEQTQTGVDDFTEVFEYSNVESEEELVKQGTQRLKELWEPDKLSIDFDGTSDTYDIGDIVGATDNITGISVTAVITKKIVTIKDGQTTISYKVGE